MKKKIVALILLLTMAVGIFSMTGCGNRNKNPVKETYDVPENGYDGSAVTITFYHSMGANLQAVLNTYITEFNKMYPNITIEHSSMGDYDGVRDTIKTNLTAGNQPNIAYCYPDHVALYNIAKKVVPLDNFINSTIPVVDALGNETVLGFTAEQVADFIPGFYAEGAVYDVAGTMYTLPMSKSTEALYYNKTFFENCQKIYASDIELDITTGEPVYEYELNDKGEQILDSEGNPVRHTKPNPHKGDENYNISLPTTWDEMEVVCEKILKIDPTCVPLGYDSEANWFITMCEQYGSGYTSLDEDNHFIFDNQTNRDFVKRFNGWFQKKYVTTEEIYGSYTSGLFTNTDPTKQRCYMVIGSTGGASYQTPPKVKDEAGVEVPLFETGMAKPPQLDTANAKVISQGPSLCIFKDDNPQEVVASWLFAKFLTSNVEFQAEFSMKSGYIPVIKSVQSNSVYSGWLNKANGFNNLQALSVKLALTMTDDFYVSYAFNGSSTARDQVGILMQDALVSTGNIDEVLDRLFKKAIDECEYAL